MTLVKRKHMIWFIPVTIAIAAALWGPIVSNVEQAKYTLVQKYGDIEIRRYAACIVAEAEVTGEREEAINKGFRTIADYIFGNNTSMQKVAMTAPVIQQSEKIAMTAPVLQQSQGSIWKVQFVMPSQYTLETLPKPNNASVKLKAIEAKQYGVIRFSGFAGQESLKEHKDKLEAFLQEHNFKTNSPPLYAFYNPPWTLPFLRRNEIMFELSN